MPLLFLCAQEGKLCAKIYLDFHFGDYVCWKCLGTEGRMQHINLNRGIYMEQKEAVTQNTPEEG